MQYRIVFGVAASMAFGASAAPSPAITPSPSLEERKLALKRDSLPASSGSSVLSDVYTIAAGESFDGGMYAYDRGVDCEGQTEGGDSDAVFQIEEGGTLSNVIIGPNQMEGVHCQGACTLTNVWWSAVCEDAFTIKNQDAGDTTYISGGGAFGADDKVLQHNGGGSLSVSDFTVDTFGKLYRSCGNCDTMYERHVIMDGITAVDGNELAGINYNYGDSATFTNIAVSGVDDICVTYTGTDDNNEEPSEYGSGADGTYCIYSDSDISGDTSSSSDSSDSGSSAAASSAAKTTSTKKSSTKTSSAASKSTAASDDDEDSTTTKSSKTTSSAKSTKTSSSKSTKTSSSSKSTSTSESGSKEDAAPGSKAFGGFFRW
ncbi:putative Pectate lyase [Seiridium unicorne]|uniref:Pectate lyase n=1 Tax=Seiridium unicorne TaxID=138068 RepID=A0ABR2V5T4_9PEZI